MLTCANCGRESPDDFAFCPACASPLQGPAAAHEVRKTVTVVFCDITGSTAMGENLDPESLRRVMSRYYEEMKTALERHGGTVQKFIGDAVMAVFGVPQVHEDDALRAVRAAEEMRRALTQLNKALGRDHGVTLTTRIGVNTGEVVAGDPSGDEIVLGDAVNVAARLEQGAAPGEVLIGSDTYRLVRDAVVVESVEPLELKGKSQPVPAYRLLDVTAGAAGVARRLDSPMVGRDRQLGQLRQAFDAAVANRSCQLFTVLGPPGIGKSRLVEEFLAGVSEAATVLRGRCLAYGDGITFFPVGEVVKEAAGLEDFDAPEEVERKICAVLGEEDRGQACVKLAQLFGISGGDGVTEETFWAVRRFLESMAQTAALVVVFDDIHWGEPTFLDLVEHIAKWSRDAPILLLCMARPELLDERHSWGGGKLNAATISLERLSDIECEELIANLLGRVGLPDEARTRILEAAEGTPLFVEQMLSMLIDDGLLSRDDGHWVTIGDLTKVPVPPTIQALLAARLDRLRPDERAVIERAAVAGKQFHVGALAALFADDEHLDLRAVLKGLVRRDLIGSDRSLLAGEDAFRFRHLLVRDAAYGSIPKAVRARLHERFADWLVRVAGDRVEEQEEIVGYHLEQAYRLRGELGPVDERGVELAKRAGERLGAAGGRALARGDMAGAVSLLSRASSLFPEDEQKRLQILPKLGSALARVGELGRADAVLSEAIDAALASDDRRLEHVAMVERSSWRLWTDPWSQDEARGVAERAIRVFEDAGDELGLAKAWHLLADVETRWRANTEALERALAHARRAGDGREEADILWWLAVSFYFGPMPVDEAIRHCNDILNDAKGDRTVEAGTLGILAGLNAMGGRFQTAREMFANGIGILEELGFKLRMASRRTVSGAIELLAGDPVAAERELRWGFERLEEIGEHQDLPGIAGQLAEALYRQGRYGEAEPFAEISESEGHGRMRWRGPHAKLLARGGELERAQRVARETVRRTGQSDNLNTYGNALMDLAEVLHLSGRLEEAVSAVHDGLRVYEQKGNLASARLAREFLENLSASAPGAV